MAHNNLEDWSSEWTDGDSRILTLKKKCDDLKQAVENNNNMAIQGNSDMSGAKADIGDLKSKTEMQEEEIANLFLLQKLNALVNTDLIDKKEYRTLLKLYNSPDPENRTVLVELVEEKFKLI